ncbi:TPM domain-containing protein [Psychrobacter aestuarii]|uniref:TPM domain-containing protein n=1 Tax=Psychrobacter aestuarii TaxID=556327 RepID=A0ABP3FAH6_9GAMM|nr:TPM domain-containing protein [Psychrobacter aestuarii]
MDVFKKIATVSLLVYGIGGAPLVQAAPNDAEATITRTQAAGSSDQAVDDVVAISRAGQGNEAINDAVLGNEAINDGILNNDAINPRAASDDDIATASAEDTPAPRTSNAAAVDADKLILNSPVVDEANILTSSENQQLTAQLQSIYQQGLAQAAVVIVPTTNGVPIFDYALQVAEKWQLGREDVDDGLLIVLAVNDREVYVLTGYGLEGVIPDVVASRIIREDMTPYFKQNDYAGGLSAGINRIESRLTADPEVLARADEAAASQQAENSDEAPSTIVLFIMALIFGTFLTQLLGRIFGSLVTAGGFFAGSLALGGGFFMTLIMAIFLWMFLISRRSGGGGKGGSGGRGGGGMIVVPGFGGGGGSGGGFGGGGFGGGGGGFGGGGAGGSW